MNEPILSAVHIERLKFSEKHHYFGTNNLRIRLYRTTSQRAAAAINLKKRNFNLPSASVSSPSSIEYLPTAIKGMVSIIEGCINTCAVHQPK